MNETEENSARIFQARLESALESAMADSDPTVIAEILMTFTTECFEAGSHQYANGDAIADELERALNVIENRAEIGSAAAPIEVKKPSQAIEWIMATLQDIAPECDNPSGIESVMLQDILIVANWNRVDYSESIEVVISFDIDLYGSIAAPLLDQFKIDWATRLGLVERVIELFSAAGIDVKNTIIIEG